MEWIQTTGPTVAAALEAALDQLGVHEDDVEYEVLEEPKTGLLSRFTKSEARIRVRLKPISREKPQDRRRGRTKGGSKRSEGPRRDKPANRPSHSPSRSRRSKRTRGHHQWTTTM